MQTRRFWCNYRTGVVVETADFDSGIRTRADDLDVPPEARIGFEKYHPVECRLLYEFLYRNAPLVRWQIRGEELFAEFCAEDDTPALRCVAVFAQKENFPPEFPIHITNCYKLQRRHCRWRNFPGEVR